MIEMVDVVDERDRPLAVVTRARMREENLLHRVVFVAIVSSADEVLIHRRSPHKDVWPGRWDLAVGGVVRAGEDYAAAATRELAEELGVAAPVEGLGRGRYEDDDVRLLARLYRARHDGPFHFADGEVVEATWVTTPDLLGRVRRQPFVPDSVALVLPLLVPAQR